MRRIAVAAVMILTVVTARPSSRQAATANSAPAVSPDGTWIAFSSNRTGAPDLYVIASQGGGERQITSSPEREGPAQWSRDGALLYYAIDQDDTSRLYAVDVASGRSTDIGVVRGRVAFQLSRKGWSRIWQIGIDGAGARELLSSDLAFLDEAPSWFPDGGIAFQSTRSGRMEIWTASRDDTAVRQLTGIDRR